MDYMCIGRLVHPDFLYLGIFGHQSRLTRALASSDIHTDLSVLGWRHDTKFTWHGDYSYRIFGPVRRKPTHLIHLRGQIRFPLIIHFILLTGCNELVSRI